MSEPDLPHEMEDLAARPDLPFAHRNAYGRTGRALVATLSRESV